MPTKLNMLLKYRYNSARNFKDIKSGYEGNFCEISDEDIGKFLGNIDNEIVRILMTNNYMGDNHKDLRDNKLFNQMRNYIIWAAFYCARKLGWIVSNPPKNKKGNWRFNLNRYYFTGIDK
ncbi:MAG: hypothetical protein Nk1A_5760 [Endomicrobiia bacterium]|nr:MAG: hypothetical protein Nk1A_5760 [Endomicrobiia bacterium]